MTWSDVGIPDLADWFARSGAALGRAASTISDCAAEAVGLIVGTLVLISLLPAIAHAALAFVLMLLGGPIWFVVALFFAH